MGQTPPAIPLEPCPNGPATCPLRHHALKSPTIETHHGSRRGFPRSRSWGRELRRSSRPSHSGGSDRAPAEWGHHGDEQANRVSTFWGQWLWGHPQPVSAKAGARRGPQWLSARLCRWQRVRAHGSRCSALSAVPRASRLPTKRQLLYSRTEHRNWVLRLWVFPRQVPTGPCVRIHRAGTCSPMCARTRSLPAHYANPFRTIGAAG